MHTRFLLLCCLFMTQSISATEVEGLFTADVTARSQSLADRNGALNEALQLVFSRFFITNDFVQNPVLKAALGNAASYVGQYQYLQLAGDTATQPADIMRVTFNKNSLTALMRTSGLALWGAKREKTLLWLAIEQGTKEAFLDIAQDTEIAEALQHAESSNGIPLSFPLMDLEEKQAISVMDILSTKPDKALAASERYGVKAVLSGKLVKRRTCWRSEWALHVNNMDERWATPCGKLKANLTSALQTVYQYLSVFYAQKP